MKIGKLLTVLAIVTGLCSLGLLGLSIYGSILESNLRQNIVRVRPGMTEDEVIALIGAPSSRSISDGAGVYWWYRTDYPFAIIDDNQTTWGILLFVQAPTERL